MMFNKETNFKETPIGKIPKDWEVVGLRGIVKDKGIYYGITAKAVEKETKLRMLRTTDIKNYCVDWDTLPFCEITEKRKNLVKYFLKRGDLIVARAGTTGVSVLVDGDLDNVVFGSYLIKIKLKDNVYPNFIHYFFQSNFYWTHITSSQAGSTLKNINLPILKSLKIPLPPLLEQQKISKVLSTFDEAIQKVDEVIAKTERLKKGLMQELLTKGIGHKEIKETEIGRIPKEWEVVRLGEITKVTVGYVGPISEYYTTQENGVPLLSTTNISEDGIKLDDLKYITQKFYNKNKKVQVFPGDILIARHGESGSSAAIPANIEKACCLNVVIVRRSEKFIPKFVEYVFNFQRTRMRLVGWKAGSVQGVVNTKVLEKFKIPLPPLPEQQKIAKILSTVDKKLELERNEKAKLERIEQGMMGLLLTGKIRIKVN